METNELTSDLEKANTPPATEGSTSQGPVISNPVIIWLLVVLVILLLGVTGVFAYKYYELKQQVKKQPAPSTLPVVTTLSPTPILSPQPTIDPTTSWKSYSNSTHHIFFKYPSEWSLTEKPGQTVEGTTYNTEVILSKGLVRIIMYFNMDGIGGRPMELEGTPFVL